MRESGGLFFACAFTYRETWRYFTTRSFGISSRTPATHASKLAFVSGWMQALCRHESFNLARATQQRYLIRQCLEQRIKALRQVAVKQAYQDTLFGEGRETRVSVQEDFRFEFHPYAYAPSRDYDGRFGRFDFKKHFYGRIGDFDTPDEFLCARQLAGWAQQGRIKHWARNLVRKEGCAFFLQKADGRFYPDFVCELPYGVVTRDTKGAPMPHASFTLRIFVPAGGPEEVRIIDRMNRTGAGSCSPAASGPGRGGGRFYSSGRS